MKQVTYFILTLLSLLATKGTAQEVAIFPKGEKGPNVHHVGDVWLKELNQSDSIFNYSIAQATFAPNARLFWHVHPGGQVLLITGGTGYYQEKGKAKQIVHKGDVIKCLPGVEHWHGATPNDDFAYVATTPTQNGKTIWLQPVKDDEYYQPAVNSANNTNIEQEITALSKAKWRWMAEKNVDSLAMLFNEKAAFVHMGGSWGKEQELDIIKTGKIHYKKADIHDVSVSVIGNTAILLNNITLLAVVGGNEVTNQFMATEVYLYEQGKWTLGALSFTKLLAPTDAKH